MIFSASSRRSVERLAARNRTMPRRVLRFTNRAIDTNASEFERQAKAGVRVASGGLRRSIRNQRVTLSGVGGVRKFGRAVTAGNKRHFYAQFEDTGTRAGNRAIVRGARAAGLTRRQIRQQQRHYRHPGTTGSGFFRARYRILRPTFRRRMVAAYRNGAKSR